MKKLDNYLPNNSNTDYNDIIKRFERDEEVKNFIQKNNLDSDTLMRGSNKILTFLQEKNICAHCKGMYECKLITTGFWPELSLYNGDIELEYSKCKYNKSDSSKQNISAFYVPKKIFQASFEDFLITGPERKEVHRYMVNFVKNYSKDNYIKGVYLSGIYGTGKTYILAVLANELAKKGLKVLFVYYPDLVRELKSSIGTPQFEEKIKMLKSAEVLFLDDIGGETPNQFIRDEVLGPVLQYRLLDNKPTHFSSNLRKKTLLDALCKDNTSLEKTKAARIVERITSLTTQFSLTEKPQLS